MRRTNRLLAGKEVRCTPMLLILLWIALTACQSAEAADMPLHPGSVIRLSDLASGREAITRRDRYVESLSPFDRQARLRTDREVTEQEFLEYFGQQILEWEEDESRRLAGIVESISKKLEPWKLNFPSTVLLVKTTGREEAQAAYCRGPAVFLPRGDLSMPIDKLETMLTHELFHVLSSHNPALRKQLYQIVGFRPCNDVVLPAALQARRISNPDAPSNDYYLEVLHKGQTLRLIPVLLSKQERFDPRQDLTFFHYMTFKLLEVEQVEDQWRPVLLDGEAALREPEQVPAFYEHIGLNTRYIIHPEEVLADNFVLLVEGKRDVPTPRILTAMDRVLREHGAAKQSE